MLAGTVESLVLSLSINTCCCCVDHRLGSALLGIAHLTLSVCFLVVNVVWTVTMSKENVCYGPIAIPEDQDCYENLNKSSSQLAREIIAIFNYAQVFITNFKVSFETYLVLIVLCHMMSILISGLMAVGAIRRKKRLLIPWLVWAKIFVFFMFVFTALIVFLEAKLFNVGTTVFGLFSLLTLFLGCLGTYFWLVVQSLYLRLEQSEFSSYDVRQTPEFHANEAFDFPDVAKPSYTGSSTWVGQASCGSEAPNPEQYEVVVLEPGFTSIFPAGVDPNFNLRGYGSSQLEESSGACQQVSKL